MFGINPKLSRITVALIAVAALVSTILTGNAMPLAIGAVMLMARDPSRSFGMTLADGNLAEALENAVKDFRQKSEKFGTISGELAEIRKELEAKEAKHDTSLKSIREIADSALTQFNGLKTELESLEQKLAQGVQDQQASAKTWGEQFVNADSYKSKSESYKGTLGNQRSLVMSANVKQVTSAAAGGLIRSVREADIVQLQRERPVVRDLLRTVPIATSSVDYAVQTTRTNNAAPVAEGASKPYSDYAWGSATAVVRTLAHLAKITRQAMDDAPRLIGEIDSEMRYGLGFVEERQFLYGTGVGQNLHGIMPQATAFAVPGGFPAMTNGTNVDVLRIAMLQASLGLLPADGIVMNALDWAMIELQKTDDGAYLFANPQGTVDQRLWGLRVIATPAMTAGDFLVGNFALGATVYDRMGVEVLISTENVDDFERNLATMRAEERVAIAVKRPQAFIKGTFSTALTDVKA
jgi:HK97 family phage major capsid protein